MNTAHHHRRAFTIVELVVAMVVMSVIAGVITPVIVSATDNYASSRDLRTAVDNAAFAIDAMVRVVRETPMVVAGDLDLAKADSQSFVPVGGRGFSLGDDSILELITPAGNGPLARDVRMLDIVYLLDDGLTTASTPAEAHRVHITADISGVRVSAVAFPRVNVGGRP
jgi:prepilin-type N-terminal cleavage/methylation domain-containing protein